ncbi:hypothetical protein CR194_14295 [Salipaludibacillus keqinensis]|uniref:Flagellar export chaperone FliS n=1 Tax=Salipaludibacillus keqinensis TaxID=2045207 RepID=A0A323TDR6_9BACI|nr:hypothetical protein CR194_14295 [Salipaludibacillus keqinensis]
MAVNNPYATYKQSSVETKSAGELTLMLYDGCLKFIKRAEKAITDNNIEEKNTNLIKAQNIIRELMVTLNTDVAVSQNMMQMYDFIMSKLVDANTGSDLEALKEAERFVVEFRDTWKEVIKLDRQQRHGSGKSVGSTHGQAVGRITPEKKAVEKPASTESERPTIVSAASKSANPYAKAPVGNNPYAKAKQAAAAAGVAHTTFRK